MESPKIEKEDQNVPRTDSTQEKEKEDAPTEVPIAGGRNGLRNIGNTCYMNTGLQCLSHIPDLAKLFLTKEFMKMLNKDNVMGSGGLVAESFSQLLEQLWTLPMQVVNPSNFKRTFEGYDKQFAGVEQHDSQEFFAKLVDVLHEDLNLIKKKPYIETPVYTSYEKGQGAEMWDVFLKRNTSAIVDLLYGLTCTSIRCSECGEMRVRYEPNNVLMLPMPTEKFKLVLNILTDRDLEEEYDEAAEDKRRKAAETAKKKFIPFRACHLKYCEVDYDFYGLCSDLYAKAAAHIDVSPDQIDLFVETIGDDCPSAQYIPPNTPQSVLSQFCDASSYLVCTVRPSAEHQPILLRFSYMLAYTGSPQPYCSINHYVSRIVYVKPDETADAFLKRMSSLFMPKFKRMAGTFGGKVRKVLTTFLDHCREAEKMIPAETDPVDPVDPVDLVDSVDSVGVAEEEENEDLPPAVEQKTKITSFFKGSDKEKEKESEKEKEEEDEEDEDFEMEGNEDEDDLDMTECSSCDGDCHDDDCHDDDCRKREECTEQLPLKRRRVSCLCHSNEEYCSGLEMGCGFPLLFDPYASVSMYDALPEWFVNSLLLKSQAETPMESLLHHEGDCIPSCDLLIDGDVQEIHRNMFEKAVKEETNPEEDAALDELHDAHAMKIMSMHYCKTASWRKKHNVKCDVDLKECFEMMKKKGNNDKNSLWFCPKCQKDVLAEATTWIWKSPRYLIIQLSRFEYVTNEQLGGMNVDFENRRRKVETRVVFPLKDLDVGAFVHEDGKEGQEFHYDLVAVCNHFGTADYGHYVAFCKDNNDGEEKWYRYDDELVTRMSEDEVVTADAYMLIYQRQGAGNCNTKEVLELIKSK